MKRALPVLALALLLTGCSTTGLRPLPRGRTPDAPDLPARFARAMPSRYRLLNLVVLKSFGRSLSMLGVIEVDGERGSFKAMGFTLTGVKMFEMSYAGGELRQESTFKAPGAGLDVGAAIAEDIREMYLGLVPGPDALRRRAGPAAVYAQTHQDGRTEHWFGGPGGYLVEKRVHAGRRAAYRIGYYDYRQTNGVVFPHEIVVVNARRHYQLIARPREITLL